MFLFKIGVPVIACDFCNVSSYVLTEESQVTFIILLLHMVLASWKVGGYCCCCCSYCSVPTMPSLKIYKIIHILQIITIIKINK